MKLDVLPVLGNEILKHREPLKEHLFSRMRSIWWRYSLFLGKEMTCELKIVASV